MAEIRAIAKTIAKEGHELEVRKALEALIAPGNAEEGVIQYELHVDAQKPREFYFIERWESAEAFAKHVKAPQIAPYFKAVEGLLESAEVIMLNHIGG